MQCAVDKSTLVSLSQGTRAQSLSKPKKSELMEHHQKKEMHRVLEIRGAIPLVSYTED